MLAVIGILTSVVGAYYYLRVVKVMYFDKADTATQLSLEIPHLNALVMWIISLLSLVIFLAPSSLLKVADAALGNLFSH